MGGMNLSKAEITGIFLLSHSALRAARLAAASQNLSGPSVALARLGRFRRGIQLLVDAQPERSRCCFQSQDHKTTLQLKLSCDLAGGELALCAENEGMVALTKPIKVHDCDCAQLPTQPHQIKTQRSVS